MFAKEITPHVEDRKSSCSSLNEAPNSSNSSLVEVPNPSLNSLDSFQEFDFDSFSTFDSYTDIEPSQRSEDNPVWYDLTQNINDLDDNQDVIPLEDSEHRLNSLCLFLAFILMILSSIFTGLCYKLFKPPLVLYMNHSGTNQVHRVPHLMILLSGGSMTPYSWNPQQTSKVKFPQFPESMNFGLESYNDNLYVFSLTKFNGFTSITPNGTHRLILKQRQVPMFNEIKDEGKSVLVNNFIWILGGFLCPPKNAKDNLNSVLYAAIGGLMSTEEDVSWYKHCRQVNETMLWSVPRQNWIEGPQLPHNFDLKYGCVTAYNRSTVFIIGSLYHHKTNRDGFVHAYDFEKYLWNDWYERMPLDPTTGYHQRYHTTCAVHHTKKQSLIVAMTSPGGFETSVWKQKYVTLWTFEVQSNQWTKVLVQNMKSKGKVAILQGIIHYFPYGPNDPYASNLDSLGFYFEPKNKTFIPLVQENLNFSINLYATPCYLQM